MAQSESSQSDRIESLLERLAPGVERLSIDVERLSIDVERLSTDVERLSTDVDGIKQEMVRTNDRVEVYQKASQQVVNLAFGLILTSALAIIIPAVVNR